MSGVATMRLPKGGRIDRSKPLRFTFDGQSFTGFDGDTLASALLANGEHLVARSFKLHRPRGIVGFNADEPNALVTVGTGARATPNLRATQVQLTDGLEAFSQNRYPSLRFDLHAALDWFRRFLPAGFYYKTFFLPSWKFYEGAIRGTAGLGRAPTEPDPDRYTHRFAHADVLVVGGGPAGLLAAQSAAEAGARVLLVDEREELGGDPAFHGGKIDGRPVPFFLHDLTQRLARLPNVRLLSRTQAFGYYDHNLVALAERCAPSGNGPAQRLWYVRAKQVVLATGAIERPLVFPNNDRPGILLAGAARAYLQRHAVLVGQAPVVFTNNDSAYGAAFELAAEGARVTIVDVRSGPPAALVAACATRGIEVIAGAVITDTSGRMRVDSVELQLGERRRRVACDAVLMAGGWTPVVHLFSQSGGKLRFDDAQSCFVPANAAQQVTVAGSANGTFGLAGCVADGVRTGTAAASRTGHTGPVTPTPSVADEPSFRIEPFWGVPAPQARGKQWVDFQNDVTSDDIALAARESFRSVELLKRYTTTGMATDQGKTSNVNALALLAQAVGKSIPEVGTTTFRPPYTPVTFGTIAGTARGDLFRPRRYLPAHQQHVQLGAQFADFGTWQRPEFYLRPGESEAQAIAREWKSVRGGVGLFDSSPLGKIEVHGPDAGAFLDRMYLGQASNLGVGKLRYGLMLSEHGIVIDDGVFARLAETRFLVGSTSGMASQVAARFEEWLQCEWPDLRVAVCDVTTGWASITAAGPKARDLVRCAGTDIDLSPDAFPHMTLRTGKVAGIEARVQRVSFTGEVQYEIAVPWSAGAALWQALYAAGAAFDVAPIGLETWIRARIEKGYIHVGSDTDGTTYPTDIGFAVPSKKQSDFVGRRSLTRPDAVRPDRFKLVGFESLDPKAPLPVGAHVLPRRVGEKRSLPDGRITSSCVSPVLQRSIALGLLKGGLGREGEVVTLQHDGATIPARVVKPVFYDPEGVRLHG
jgi:sarcosine oxidase, subunit alpha